MLLNKRAPILDQSHYAPYMNAKTFVKLAKALNLQISIRRLESFEEQRAVFPSLRTAMPDGFPDRLITMYRVKSQAQSKDIQQWFSSPRIKCSKDELTKGNPDFEKYLALHEGLQTPTQQEQFERILTEGFPLEHELLQDDSLFLENPSEGSFEAWDSWRIPGLFIDRKHTYYSPWQVIELYDVISTHHVYSHAPRVEDERWSIFRKSCAWNRSNKMANLIHPLAFVPADADVEKHWPSPWSAWKTHLQKVFNFQWCQYVGPFLQRTLVFDDKSTVEPWKTVNDYLKLAAERHTFNTTLDEWIRLINALYAFAQDVDKREKRHLGEFILKIINYTVELIKSAYDLSTVEIIERCDKKSFPPPNARLRTDKQMRLLYLLDPVEWVFQYQLKNDVKQLAGFDMHPDQPIVKIPFLTPVSAQTVDSFLHMLCSNTTGALTGPMIEWYLLLFLDDDSHSTHILRLGVLRTLLSSMESETRRWFKADSMREVFDKAFPSKNTNTSGAKGWQDFYDNDWKNLWETATNNTEAIRRISSVEELIQVASVLRSYEETEHVNLSKRLLGIHILMTYIARNWSAHVGDNPPRVQKHLERFMFRSVLRTLIVLWHLRPSPSSN